MEADSGQIGGKVTTEFMALAESGEASLVYCDACDYAANVEAASTGVVRAPAITEARPMRKVHTPELRTIRELAQAMGISEHDTVKTMVGVVDDDSSSDNGRIVFLCVPGDRELNPVKAAWSVPGIRLLDEEEFAQQSLPKGSLGPLAPPTGALVIADRSLEAEVSWGIGANENDYHFFDAMPGRDFTIDRWDDLVVAKPGDICPTCGSVLMGARGIEVSQVFQLGTRYSEAMGATFMAEDGSERQFLMGCYGVGITRSLAAVIEQHADEGGVAWPVSVAPYEVAVVPLTVGDDVVAPVADSVAHQLADAGI